MVMNNKNEYIFDVNEDQFNQKVLESSENKLVIVDFWAPWCGPCKQLTPVLENIINKLDGSVHLVKVNIDENQQIAGQLNIQSIPAVFAFKGKKAVDAFQGVLPEKEIIKFIEKHLGKKVEKDYSEFHKIVEIHLEQKNYNEAKNTLESHFVENSDDEKSMSMYIDCLAEMLLFDEADEFIKSINDNILNSEVLKPSIQKLEIKKKNSHGPSLDSLKKTYEKNSKNIKNILALAEKLFADNFIDDAFDLLFKHYKLNQSSIKTKLLDFFEVLGNTDPKTIINRRRLSSLIFS